MDTDSLDYKQLPQFIMDANILLNYMKKFSYNDLKSIWKCNDKIATQNYKRIQTMNLYKNLTPAILSFDGIQYKYMAPDVFDVKEFSYLEKHVRILSGFYGMLKPLDGVVPYRLEMQAKLNSIGLHSLYSFWNQKLANQLFLESSCIINLASKEYSQCISKYLDGKTQFISCVFGEMIGNKVVEKGTLVKIARGEMVRFMVENQIENVEEIKNFNRFNYVFVKQLSDKTTFTFIKENKKRKNEYGF